MTTFDDWPHLIWNAIAIGVLVSAVVALFLPRSRRLRHGWKSVSLWLVAIVFVGLPIGGFYLPIGPIAALVVGERGWSQPRDDPALDATF